MKLEATDFILKRLRAKRERQMHEEPPDPRFARYLPDGTPRVSPAQICMLLSCGERFKE